jgi:hypothetical protein
MADLGTLENWDHVEAQQPLEALPAGAYTLVIVESDAAMVESAQGRRISVTYEVVGGPYDGRKSWDRFDIDRTANTKNGERMIDLSRFKTLCEAVGLQGSPRDTSQLHAIPFQASARVETDPSGRYAPKNLWGSYRPAQGGPPAPQQAAPMQRQPAPPVQRQAAPPPAANGGGKMAWPGRR